MPQPHSFTSPRLLVTIPSHILNLPPSKPYMQEYLFLNFTASPLPDFLLDSKSFPKPPPQNHTCKSMPQLHRLPPSRVLVTIPSHFFNFPPQNFTCKSMPQLQSLPSPRLLVLESKSFSKPPPPRPYMQEYSSTSQLHLSKSSCHDSKSFFKPPPQNLSCKNIFCFFKVSLGWGQSPHTLAFLVHIQRWCQNESRRCASEMSWSTDSHLSSLMFAVFAQDFAFNHEHLTASIPVQRKKKHADSCGFIRDYRFHRIRSIWLPT